LLQVGDGKVVEHFADPIRADDANHRSERRIEAEKSGQVTERQFLARIRTFAGSPAITLPAALTTRGAIGVGAR
jgi:hypothetical protein